ncbi:MAG: HupE/UreJ family protein [Rugosibacter sp.]
MKKMTLLLSAMLPCFAYAHTGTDSGMHHHSLWQLGFHHPLIGMAYLAAMLLLGIWSVQRFRQQRLAKFAGVSVAVLGSIVGFALFVA